MNEYTNLDKLLHHVKYRFMSKKQLEFIIDMKISFDNYKKLYPTKCGALAKAAQLHTDFKKNIYPIKYNNLTIDEVNKIC